VDNYKTDLKMIWQEIFDEYITVGKKIIIDYALRYHRERRKWGVLLLKRPKLSFSQKIFEAGGFHRQFHERWHRVFENSKRFMTREFFGINGLSLALHQWFQSFKDLSLCELQLTSSLGQLDCALSLKEFFLFQNFYRKKVLGFINQILIRGAYFLIKKRKVFCRKEFINSKWSLWGCVQHSKKLWKPNLSLREIKGLLKRTSRNKESSDVEFVICLLQTLEEELTKKVEHVGFEELMMDTKLKQLEKVVLENPLIDLERTKFNFPKEHSNWDNHFYIREDFKVKILEGVRDTQSKEEFLAEAKLQKTLGTLMGLRLREILARSIEQILGFFESYGTNPMEEMANLFSKKGSNKILKKIRNETYTPIFKVELVVDNGVLKLGEIQKKLIQELNSFFLGLCQCFQDVRKPKFIKLKFFKNSFEKKSFKEKPNEQKTQEKEETVLGKT
jgi:hypothetical protein